MRENLKFNFRHLATWRKLNARTFLTRKKKLHENFPIYGNYFTNRMVIHIGYTMKPRGLRDLDTRARSARVFMVSKGI